MNFWKAELYARYFAVMEYVVLANKHNLHKLTQNSVFNKIYNAVKHQYPLCSFKEFYTRTMKRKNTKGFKTLVQGITTATRERNPNSEQSMRPLSSSTSIITGYRPHSFHHSLWLAFITHTHPSLNHTFNHQVASLLHAAKK